MSGPTPQQIGNEKREQILPTMDIGAGFKIPDYDLVKQIPTPSQVNVSRGDSFGHVVDAAKGVAYYADVIGFGQSSSGFTSGMPFNKYGLNYFVPTGLKCSNGANMWTYFEGIPKGDAFGETIKGALKGVGLADLKGLAPGIVEDTKAALNPNPLLQAAFGNVYPVCELKTLPVGDDRGLIQDPKTGDLWVQGDVEMKDGRPHQTKWVQKVDAKGNPVYLTQKEWNQTPKTRNPDGSPVSIKKKEGFLARSENDKASILVAVVFLSIAFGLTCK